jgi:hypothetical protein
VNRRKFRIKRQDEEWLLYEPGFVHVPCHRTDSFEEMIQDFHHILRSELIKLKSR